MRWSRCYIPTLKEAPSDAEVVSHKHDACQHQSHQREDDDGRKEAHVSGTDELCRFQNAAGDTGDDTREDDQRNTVAQSLLGYLFTQPHDEHSARGQGDDGHKTEGPPGFKHDRSPGGAVHALKTDGDTKALDHGDQDSGIPGILGEFPLARSALFLGKPLQVGTNDLKQLQDDGCGYVRHDPEGEHRQVAKPAPGEHVKEAKKGVLNAGKEICQSRGIHTGNRDMYPYPVGGQQQECPHELAPKLRQTRQIINTTQSHGLPFQCLGFATGVADLLDSGGTELVSLDLDGRGHVTFAEDLDSRAEAAQATVVDVIKGDLRLAFKGSKEASKVDDFVLDREHVLEATLGQTTLQRHLATFEAGTHTAACAGILTLVTLTGRAAETGAGATAYTLARLAFLRERIQIVQSHYSLTSIRCFTLLIMPRMAASSLNVFSLPTLRKPRAATVAR